MAAIASVTTSAETAFASPNRSVNRTAPDVDAEPLIDGRPVAESKLRATAARVEDGDPAITKSDASRHCEMGEPASPEMTSSVIPQRARIVSTTSARLRASRKPAVPTAAMA